jgi:hypothetical protein
MTNWDDRPLFAEDADVTVYWPDVRPAYDAYPEPSRVAGAIGRGLVDAADAGISDAYARYLERLADLGAAAGEAPTVQS